MYKCFKLNDLQIEGVMPTSTQMKKWQENEKLIEITRQVALTQVSLIELLEEHLFCVTVSSRIIINIFFLSYFRTKV